MNFFDTCKGFFKIIIIFEQKNKNVDNSTLGNKTNEKTQVAAWVLREIKNFIIKLLTDLI
jgi:hypothetical protein